MSLSSAQCRAARALLGWSQEELAKASKVAKATIANFEKGNRSPYDRTLTDLVSALESAGIVFLGEGDITAGGPGVRLPGLELPVVAAQNRTEGNDNHADTAGKRQKTKE